MELKGKIENNTFFRTLSHLIALFLFELVEMLNKDILRYFNENDVTRPIVDNTNMAVETIINPVHLTISAIAIHPMLIVQIVDCI